jgi:ribA/ribD-fused uncharacterized protein
MPKRPNTLAHLTLFQTRKRTKITSTVMKDNINFYRQENSYGEFSNFYYAPITMAGQEWPTTEHYFQAQKFAHLDDNKYVEMVRLAKTPSDAAKLGRRRSLPLRPDWEKVKDDVMRDCVLQKFLQHPNLAKVLQGTGDRYLNGESGRCLVTCFDPEIMLSV